MKQFCKYLFAVVAFSSLSLEAQNEFAQDFFKPIQLGVGETRIILGDFFPNVKILKAEIEPKSGYSIVKKSQDTIFIAANTPNSNPITLLNVTIKSLDLATRTYSIPIKKNTKRLLKFKFPDSRRFYKTVAIKGTFNSWNPQNSQLKFENGFWTGDVWASEGIHQYVFVCDVNKEFRDPYNPDSVSNGMGSFNSKISIVSKSISLKTLMMNEGINRKIYLETNILKGATPDKLKNVRVIGLYNDKSIAKIIFNKKLDPKTKLIETCIIEIELPNEAMVDKIGFLRSWVYLSGENSLSNDILVPFVNGKKVEQASQLSFKDPRTLIIYNPMIDRFKDGNVGNNKPLNRSDVNQKVDFWGGDIQGITQKIEDGYFKKMNINTLWVSPVVKNPEGPWGQWNIPNTKFSGYHGYWPISSTETDSRFCTKNELENFIRTAEKNGMNVLLDYVAHHIHQEHPLFKSHPDWYTSLYLPDGSKNTERWDEYRLTTWFDDFMPTFNFFKPEVVEAMTDSAVWWMQHYPIYGFRHDATKHIPEIFWRTLTKKMKTKVLIPQNRPSYQIGETYGSPELIGSYIGSDLLDAQFDFNLYDAAVATFKQPNTSCKNLVDIINDSKKNYGSHHTMGNITGNQDRPRFVSLADGSLKDGENYKQVGWDRNIQVSDEKAYQRLQNLIALMVAIPGVPVIYYGDELGFAGANDPDCRRMMRFVDEKTDSVSPLEKLHFDKISKLLAMRKTEICLQYGDCEVSSLSDNLMKVERNYFGKKIVFIFNTSNKAVNLDSELLRSDKNMPIINRIEPESFVYFKN